ncbi:glycosyl transferase [Sphingomonas sp. Root710]|uniref:glycosyltransferase family 2 protein n=1 Tax=Sphingomonas sp. Root710 TaxID=1736594 RepID=UPI0006F553CB|nr:glycosyltransferase family 2 protein [Sphingomonas sp. Root710]KRB86275.1 glycosyl transferase [Sphingomonas sp. Root710]
MNSAPILVVIVNYRTAVMTARAVEAILEEARKRGDTSIIVVDNGSNDGSVEILSGEIARLQATDICTLLALETNLGFAGGNNAGLKHYLETAEHGTSPEYVWLLNPDTVAEEGALSALIDFMRGTPEAGLAGGRCLRTDGSIRPSAFRFHTPVSEFIAALDIGILTKALSNHQLVIPVGLSPIRAEWLSGAHLMIRGCVFERIGGFDARYFLFFEETDFCARAAQAGFEAWHVPASRVVHLGGQATGLTEFGSSPRQPRYWFESRARYFLRHHGIGATHIANLLWLVATPIGKAWAGLRGRPRHDPPSFWRDFLKHNYGRGGLMYQTRQILSQ